MSLTKSAICFAMSLLFCDTHKISPSRTAKYPFNGYLSDSVSLIPMNKRKNKQRKFSFVKNFYQQHVDNLLLHKLVVHGYNFHNLNPVEYMNDYVVLYQYHKMLNMVSMVSMDHKLKNREE